jgi:hypothetical protein
MGLTCNLVGPIGVRYCSMPPRMIWHLPRNNSVVRIHLSSQLRCVAPRASRRLCRSIWASTRQLRHPRQNPTASLCCSSTRSPVSIRWLWDEHARRVWETHLRCRKPLISIAPQKDTSPSPCHGRQTHMHDLKFTAHESGAQNYIYILR